MPVSNFQKGFLVGISTTMHRPEYEDLLDTEDTWVSREARETRGLHLRSIQMTKTSDIQCWANRTIRFPDHTADVINTSERNVMASTYNIQWLVWGGGSGAREPCMCQTSVLSLVFIKAIIPILCSICAVLMYSDPTLRGKGIISQKYCFKCNKIYIHRSSYCSFVL